MTRHKAVNSKGKSLQMQVVLTTVALLTATVVLLSGLYYVISSSIVMRDGYALTSQSVTSTADAIGDYLERLKSMAEVIANHMDTQAVLKNPNDQGIIGLSGMLSNFQENDSRIKTIALISKEGKILYAGDEMLMTTSEDMMGTPWYQEAMNTGQMPKLMSARRSEFSMNKEDWVISVSREIVDDQGTHLGVLLIDIDYKAIEDQLNALDLGKTGYGFIVSLEGQVVYHPDSSYYSNAEKAAELVAICELGPGYESQMGLMTFKTNVQHADWVLVGLSSLDNVKFLQVQLLQTILVATSLILIPGALISIWLSRRITRPLNLLQQAMQTIDSNLKPLTSQIKGPSEVVDLTTHYNAMLSTIHQLMDNIKEQETITREFELKALQSQINPHFLYNTLETIVWLAEFEDSKKVIEVTKSLSELMRFGLRKDQGMVALSAELNHVKHYLLIQKERYIDELDFSIDDKSDYTTYLVPKLILQPLVENAIYHGIRQKDGGGRVSIRVSVDQVLKIDVIDDGIGYKDGISESHQPKLGGLGLDNVKQRIKLLCGDDFGLEITSQQGQGTVVRVTLPVKRV